MANVVLAFPDYVMADPAFATVAFSGGAWSGDLPLSNLLNPTFAYVARSQDLALGSTRFWCDLGQARGISGVYLPKTNGTTNCQYRIRGFAVMDETTTAAVDTGWKDLYPSVYAAESLFFGHPSLWDGKMSPEDATEYPMPIVETFGVPVVAQYWLIEFSDSGNPAGYIEIPRVVIAAGWQPPINAQWSASLAIEDQAVVQEALGGALYFEARPVRRVARFTLAYLSDNDAMTWVNEMQRRLGVSGQLYFVHDPDDRTNMHRRSFLARMRVLNPLEYAAYGNATVPLELQEIVA